MDDAVSSRACSLPPFSMAQPFDVVGHPTGLASPGSIPPSPPEFPEAHADVVAGVLVAMPSNSVISALRKVSGAFLVASCSSLLGAASFEMHLSSRAISLLAAVAPIAFTLLLIPDETQAPPATDSTPQRTADKRTNGVSHPVKVVSAFVTIATAIALCLHISRLTMRAGSAWPISVLLSQIQAADAILYVTYLILTGAFLVGTLSAFTSHTVCDWTLIRGCALVTGTSFLASALALRLLVDHDGSSLIYPPCQNSFTCSLLSMGLVVLLGMCLSPARRLAAKEAVCRAVDCACPADGMRVSAEFVNPPKGAANVSAPLSAASEASTTH